MGMSIKSVLIIVDNLDIGGIQRLAVDQAYWFQDKGLECEILSLNKVQQGASIIDADGQYFQERNLRITELETSNLKRLRYFHNFFKRKDCHLVLSHSARGLLYVAIIRIIFRKQFKSIGFIHQLPVMSTRNQNLKRSIYFRFADEIHAVSNQFKLEFEYLRKVSYFYRFILPREITFNRIGIYLPRIFSGKLKNELKLPNCPIIFLGRLTKWKGFETFCEIIEELEPKRPVIVFTSPSYYQQETHAHFFAKNWRRMILGRSIANYDWEFSGIHLYPSYYTSGTKYPMSISLNVLECVALGIPSIISIEGFETWPEFRKSILVNTSTWKKEEVKRTLDSLSSTPRSSFIQESQKFLGSISIERHCEYFLSKFQ